ncbi:MAG TPA: aldo/keto reductase [Candidatus Bathyarchaeia archaeon]|nr:aldo/keto reductase [Candidatus Bathyarchaeia archaeon]
MHYRKIGRTTEEIPIVGIGTWAMGGSPARDRQAVKALKLGLDLGMTFIDTAEMYGSGHSEELVAESLKGRKEKVFVASKVSPQHFAYDDVLRSARLSLKRLQLKQMDLYQLHWPNPSIPISETMRAMETLVREGSVRHIGISNYSVSQTKEAEAALSRDKIVSNQVEYSLVDRSIEQDILPYCQKEGLTVIAYSPLGQGKIPRGRGDPFKTLDAIAERLGRSREQVALNWVLQHESVVVIPKASDEDHVRQNAEVIDWNISRDDFEKLNEAFQS